jgi:hypothetical protein
VNSRRQFIQTCAVDFQRVISFPIFPRIFPFFPAPIFPGVPSFPIFPTTASSPIFPTTAAFPIFPRSFPISPVGKKREIPGVARGSDLPFAADSRLSTSWQSCGLQAHPAGSKRLAKMQLKTPFLVERT